MVNTFFHFPPDVKFAIFNKLSYTDLGKMSVASQCIGAKEFTDAKMKRVYEEYCINKPDRLKELTPLIKFFNDPEVTFFLKNPVVSDQLTIFTQSIILQDTFQISLQKLLNSWFDKQADENLTETPYFFLTVSSQFDISTDTVIRKLCEKDNTSGIVLKAINHWLENIYQPKIFEFLQLHCNIIFPYLNNGLNINKLSKKSLSNIANHFVSNFLKHLNTITFGWIIEKCDKEEKILYCNALKSESKSVFIYVILEHQLDKNLAQAMYLKHYKGNEKSFIKDFPRNSLERKQKIILELFECMDNQGLGFEDTLNLYSNLLDLPEIAKKIEHGPIPTVSLLTIIIKRLENLLQHYLTSQNDVLVRNLKNWEKTIWGTKNLIRDLLPMKTKQPDIIDFDTDEDIKESKEITSEILNDIDDPFNLSVNDFMSDDDLSDVSDE